MAGWLHTLSWLLPLTYAYEALDRATRPAPLGGAFAADVIAVVAFTLAALGLGALTLQRRTP
jgi:ABC-2 type transport system permease protein